MKRLISMLLAAMMIISMVATTAMAVSSELPFEDVALDAWYYQHVKDAYTMNLMHGQSSVKFAPEVSMKRSEFVKILANIAGLTDEELQSKNYAAEAAKKFTDVEEDDWFASFVGWANSQDILRGYETGDVRPNNSASRQEIAVMFGRFMKAISFNWKAESETPDSLFTDNDEVADWAYYEAYLLKAMNVIAGYEDGSFRPTKPMLRSEIAKVAAEFVKFRNNELDESIPETPELSITAEADAVVAAEALNALTGALNTNKYFTSVSIANSDDALAKIAAVEPGNSAEIDLKVVFESVKYSSDRTYKLNFTRKPVAEVPNPEVPGGLTFSYTAEADEDVALEKISAIVNAEANADGKFEKVEITNGDAVVAAMSEVAAGSSSEIDVAVKYTLGEFTADRTYKLSFTRKAAEIPDPEVPEGLTFSYTAEADENVILDKISAIVNAEANADGKFEKVEITNGDAVVAAMSEVAAGSTSEIDVAVKYTLGEFTADRTYKLSFTRKASPETGKDPTAANIGTVYDENGIKISYAKKIEVDGKAILADGTGIHGGHESKVVRTPYGTFSVYVNDSRVDSDGIQWDKFTVIKISSDKFEVVFEAEYPHSQGSCAPNIFAGNGSTIYISIISVDQPKYVHQQRQEGAWLTIYEINAATNEYQSYQANPNFAVTGKGGYGYSQPIPDIENGKIYALYTGGDIPGQLAWFTFDINSHKWMPECRTVETEFRCCYFNAYADGNGGFIFVGQRDVKKSTFANLINNPAFGGSGYIQDIIYLFRVPDATKEEVISKMVRDPKYTSSTPLSGLISQRTYGTGCTYLDSDGNFHLLYSNTKGETSTLYHSVYDKELNVVSPDKSMLALFTTSKTTPRRLFMTQAPDGTFYIFASNVPKNAATAYTPAQFDIYKSSDGINFTRLIDTTVEIKTEDGTTFNCREMKFIVTAPRNNSTMDGTVGIMFYYPKTEGYSEYYDYYYMAIDFVN